MSLLMIFGGLYVVLLLFLYFYQSRLIFFPSANVYSSPESLNLAFEALELESEGTRITGWFVPGPADSPVVLFCHGNAGNIADRLEIIGHINEQGLSVLIFDYAGYGNSEGHPTEQQTYGDAGAAYQWLLAKGYSDTQIIVYGRSLGGGVASHLARQKPIRALVLEATFTSLQDVARIHYPWVPVRILMSYEYDVKGALKEVSSPVVLIQSPQDDLMPYDMARSNFEAANEPRLFLQSTGGHNNLAPVDWQQILEFSIP